MIIETKTGKVELCFVKVPEEDKNKIFILKAKKIHGDRYKYDFVVYVNVKTKIAISCDIHGIFYQYPPTHLAGKGCQQCGRIKNMLGVSNFYRNKRTDISNVVKPEKCEIIPLTSNKYSIIDSADFELLKNINWHYANGYAKNNLLGPMHRYIMNPSPNKVIDHINHDTLDNRRCNLRECDHYENISNQLPMKGKSSRYKGVAWNSEKNRWQSYIKHKKKRTHIGYFKLEIDAALAYNEYATKLFKEYAHLNVINQ